MRTKWLRFVCEEAKFIKTFADIGHLWNKLPYLAPRLLGCAHPDRRVPLSLQIEPTNCCNIRCICCSRSTMKRPQGFMKMKLYRKIIDEAQSLNIRRVYLYAHGEPLLHPDIIEMVTYAKSRKMGVSMATNGMLMSASTGAALLKTGVNSADHFTFSILGHSKSIHESIMRDVNHEQVKDNLIRFIGLRNRSGLNGPVIEAVMYEMPQNRHEKKQFELQWRGVVDHVRDVGEISKQYANDPDCTKWHKTTTCNNLWERMTIYWDGRVTSCVADIDGALSIGTIEEDSIQTLWNHPELLRMRDLHRKRRFQDLNLCAHCDW